MPYSLKQTLPSVIAPALRLQSTRSTDRRDAIYDFREQDLELLKKFQSSTVFTITTDDNLHLYQKETFKLAHYVRTLGADLANPADADRSAPILDAFDALFDSDA